MNLNHGTATPNTTSPNTTASNATASNATAAADLQDIAALDRLAGQLASQATLRRYARQHRTEGSERRRTGGWWRLLTASGQH
jgi:hypothetical protein